VRDKRRGKSQQKNELLSWPLLRETGIQSHREFFGIYGMYFITIPERQKK
jgi:hypothetical protein